MPPTPDPRPDPHRNRDMERREPLTRLDDVRGPLNVVAAFGSVGHARMVIEALETAGIDGGSISLLGAQPAAEDDDVAPATEEGPMGRIGGRAVAGAAVGGVIGIGAGLVALGGAIGSVPSAVAGGIVGAGTGGAVTGAMNIGIATAWRDTFSRIRRGNVAVGVHTASPAIIDRASSIMESYAPLAMNQFGDAR